jgi:chemotaxis protein MotA
MDITTILGFALAIAGIVGGQLLEGGHVGSLLQLAAFVIVLGGTVGAVMVQSPLKVFLQAMSMARWAVVPPRFDPQAVIDQMTAWATIVRREGLLALEREMDNVEDPFSRNGLQMLVDGFEAEKIHQALDVELSAYDERLRNGARVWEAAGGYSPTIGILGAVLGLIHVMENLSDPSKLGSGIAVAFVATIYGVGLANLVFLPVSSKLKNVIREEVTRREMLQDGLVGIANGENPRLVGARLQGYLS